MCSVGRSVACLALFGAERGCNQVDPAAALYWRCSPGWLTSPVHQRRFALPRVLSAAKSEDGPGFAGEATWGEVLGSRAAVVGMLLFVLQQFSGINAIVYFSSSGKGGWAAGGIRLALGACWGSLLLLTGSAACLHDCVCMCGHFGICICICMCMVGLFYDACRTHTVALPRPISPSRCSVCQGRHPVGCPGQRCSGGNQRAGHSRGCRADGQGGPQVSEKASHCGSQGTQAG